MSTTLKQIISTVLALSFIALGVGFFVVKDIKAFVIGLVFGTIFSILKLILTEKTLNKAMDMQDVKAANYCRLHYTLRYFLTFAVLLVAVFKHFNLVAVVIGILLPVPAGYIVNIKMKKENNI